MTARMCRLAALAGFGAALASHLVPVGEGLLIEAVGEPEPEHDNLQARRNARAWRQSGAVLRPGGRPMLLKHAADVNQASHTPQTGLPTLRTWCAASMCFSSSTFAGRRLGSEMSRVTGRPRANLQARRPAKRQ